MAVELVRVVLRNGPKSEIEPYKSLYAVGEPVFLSDTGELIIKKTDGSFAVFKQLSDGEIKTEHLSSELKQKLQSYEDNIDALSKKEYIDGFEYNTETGELQFYSGDSPVGDSITIISSSGSSGLAFDGGYVDEENKLHLTQEGNDVEGFDPILLPATGGGGGTITSILKLRNLLDSNSLIIPYTDDSADISCILKYSFNSVDSTGESTGNGTVIYYVNGQQVYTGTIQQGEVTFDIGNYLKQGKNNSVKVTVTDSEDNKKSLSYSVTTTLNKITSTFPLLSKQTDSFSIPYTPIGIGTKTIHFVVDGEEVATKNVTTSNREQYQTFSLTHGSHIIKIYMTTLIDGYAGQVISNTLQYGVMYCEEGNTTPILMVEPIANNEILQFSQVAINFMVFAGDNSESKVDCYVDGDKVTSLSATDGINTWKHRITISGEHIFKLVFGELYKELTFNVSTVEIAEAETSGLKFYFNPYNRSNSEENPSQYSYQNEDGETFGITFNNIKFIDGLDGWTGNSFLIPNGSSIDIAYKPFIDDVTTTNGKTFEINFKVSEVYDYESKIISCYADDKGIYITPNNGTLAISANNVVDVQFSDNEDIKITVVISRRNAAKEGQRQLIYIYANGIISGILKYSINDNFSQINADTIHIGSDSASVEVYNARFYNVELSSYQVLDNFIADAKEPEEMIERNIRNQIFNQDNMVDYDLLPKETPYLIIRCPELPQYKGDKKSGVSGEFVDKANPDKSFTFEGAEFDVQGTSSAGYYVKNFKGKFKGGFTINGEHADTYAIEENDLPVSTFCFKADVASSEGANNICLMKLWEETTPYKTDIQNSDSRVRQAINGRPIVLYWENSETGEISFRGKYNFNNDKSTQNTFGFSEGCECWEFKDNGLALTEFSGDDFTEWENAFEARYPDGYTDTTKLQRVVSWVVSTDPNQATNSSLSSPVTYGDTIYNKDTADYRLTKFKNEFEDYFIKTPVLYYYIFTDLFLMVDSRAKNQFLTTYDGEHWMFIPYDGDTALGIDNVGKLKFGYWLEDTDKVNGQDVYNGQQSVLWNNVRKVFGEDIKQIAQAVISNGKLNCEYVKNLFNNHQNAWSEAVFCADTEVKYIEPYLNEGTLAYLDMAQGSKRSQRDCWLRDRFQYWNSKYNVGTSKDKYITLRVSQPSTSTINVVPPNTDMHITPYKNTYLNVSFGQSVKQEKGVANQVSDIVSTLDNPRDTPIYIYNAESIKSLGNLSGAYVGYCNVASATNLESIVLGSSKEGYFNEALTTLGLGNNTKLKLIDVRNCTNLSGEINAKGCNNAEEIYADGTQITSVVLPNSGRLKTLSLPSTITSLVIKEQASLSDFRIASYDNVTTLVIKNCPNMDSLDVVSKCNNLTNVALTDVNWTLDNADILDKLADLGGINDDNATTKQSILTGKVHLPSINTEKYNKYTSIWKDLTITYDVFIPQYKVTFQNDGGTELFVEYVDERSKAYDPIKTGEIGTPIKQSTVDEVYTYNGWSLDLANTSIITDMIVTATYVSNVRQYTVKFVQGLNVTTAGQTVLAEYTVDAFADVSYDGDTPKEQGSGDLWFLFDKWESNNPDVIIDETTYNVLNGNTVSGVVSDLTLTARFENCQVPVRPLMYLDRDKYEQGITEVVRDDDGNPVVQYDYLYTNDTDNFTSCYTLQQLYAICCSDYYRAEYTLDSSGDTFSHLAVGDKIRIKLNTTKIADEAIIFTVHGFNHFEKEESTTDNVQMSHVVFGMRDLLNATYQMNSSATNSGGWAKSKMRTWLNSTVFQALPEKLRSIIQPVQVLSTAGNTSIDIVTSIDRLFLFSQQEVNLSRSSPYTEEVSPNAETKGFTLYSGSSQRIKKQYNLSGNGSAALWWLRSPDPSSSIYFIHVNYNGSGGNYYTAATSNGVAFGFCVG